MSPKMLAEVVVEHQNEPQHLRTINRLFVSEPGHSLDRIKPALLDVIQGLRHHMAEEERGLFPILERVLTAQEAKPRDPPASKTQLDEAMTVNRVIQQFPRAKSVFEELFINVPMEGCACLDEVAWRHGMDSRELLQALERVIAQCRCAGDDRHQEDPIQASELHAVGTYE